MCIHSKYIEQYSDFWNVLSCILIDKCRQCSRLKGRTYNVKGEQDLLRDNRFPRPTWYIHEIPAIRGVCVCVIVTVQCLTKGGEYANSGRVRGGYVNVTCTLHVRIGIIYKFNVLYAIRNQSKCVSNLLS